MLAWLFGWWVALLIDLYLYLVVSVGPSCFLMRLFVWLSVAAILYTSSFRTLHLPFSACLPVLAGYACLPTHGSSLCCLKSLPNYFLIERY